MSVLTLSIPLPPSANNAYPTNRKTGRRFASKALTVFKAEAIPLVRAAANIAGFIAPPTAAYRLTLYHHFPDKRSYSSSDADNRIKAAKDAVAAALGFNDNRVIDVRSVKAGIDESESRCDVELEVLTTPSVSSMPGSRIGSA